MNEEYLWDRRDGQPDQFVAQVERALAKKRYRSPARRRQRQRMMVAMVPLAAVLLAALWLGVIPNPMGDGGTSVQVIEPTAPPVALADQSAPEMETADEVVAVSDEAATAEDGDLAAADDLADVVADADPAGDPPALVDAK
ncbi:MAG: hypothetical protein AAF628_36860 [Planctomycetota bacterium]